MDELSDQLGFLASSAAAFDKGNYAESKRLATVVYNLIYDGKGRTISLCTHLGLLPKMNMISTAPDFKAMKGYIPAASPLTHLELSAKPGPIARPSLERSHFAPRWMSISAWLGEHISNPGTKPLSRRNIIHFVRSQDGGSHIDGEITDDAYLDFRLSGLSPSVRLGSMGKEVPLRGAVAATIRQIAWEVEHSIVEALCANP